MRRQVLVLNGPNLGRLGRREPQIYGTTIHDDLAARLIEYGRELGLDVEVRQTDSEERMMGWIHQAADDRTPVVINPAAWSHYNIAIADALVQLVAPCIEVHISNIAAREEFRHHSVVSAHVTGTIAGLGLKGYELALSWLATD